MPDGLHTVTDTLSAFVHAVNAEAAIIAGITCFKVRFMADYAKMMAEESRLLLCKHTIVFQNAAKVNDFLTSYNATCPQIAANSL